MSAILLPILTALFVWWFSTGLIMYLDGLPRRTFRWSLSGAALLLAASAWGIHASAGDASVTGAYVAFTCALVAWGWQEMSFYTGFITGPRRTGCPDGCSGAAHFWHAVQTTLWHEVSIIVTFAAMLWLTWEQPNKVALWTFVVLWWMHESARINVVLGVRNLNEEFLPEHLAYLRSYLTRKPMNLLFPVSITASTICSVLMVQQAIHAAGAFERTGAIFLATMMILATLEHWFLMLPLPAQALWNWSLKSRDEAGWQPPVAAQDAAAPARCTCHHAPPSLALRPTGELP